MSKFPDESRPSDLGYRGQLLRLAAEPSATAEKYLGLRERSRKADAERKALVKRLADAEKRGRRAAAAEAELRKRRAESEKLQRQLRAAREEAARLKADLARVRGSRAMKLGKSILAPARVAKRALEGAAPESAPRAVPEPPSTTSDGSRRAQQESGAEEQTLDDLLQALAAAPDAGALHRALNALWFQEGEIERPAALIEEHSVLLEDASEKLRVLVAQVRAAAELRAHGYPIPPRAPGTAFRPEPGRVLYCVHSTPAFGSNGYAIRTGGVAQGLLANGVDVVAVARAGFPWDSGHTGPAKRTTVERGGVEYVHHPGTPLSEATTLEAIDEAADAFLREARRQRPELVHAASNYLTALPALLTARRLGVPFVYEVRGIWELSVASERPGWERSERFQLQADLEDLVLRSADRVLAITTQVAGHLVERGVDEQRIDVLPNAVDAREQLPLPRDLAYAEKLGLDPTKPWIGFAGSLVPYEGLDILLRAVALLRERELDFQVVIAGGGKQETELKALRDDLGLDGVVKFLGRRPHDEMPRLLSLIDIVPCPRLDETVTRLVSPLKPLEAFANGKAVVLSDLAPHRDLAGPDQQRALLCAPGSPASLADALELLLTDQERREELGRRGRLWVTEERRWADVCRTATSAYRAARLLPTVHGPALSDLRVGLIADEFTTKTIQGAVDVVPLERGGWRSQLDGLDLVLVESAWSGNGGAWHRGVGYYSEEEHADVRALLEECRRRGIPTTFWNKEDPVHTDRFLPTAALCDHVFTVDADLIRHYRQRAPSTLRSVVSIPFYAQPAIHNPLSRGADHDSIAYAGTYYGDRYPQRTKALDPLLAAAQEVGLAIYDRQAMLPDSPYRFPDAFRDAVKGGLPYDQVLETYRSHVAHLNVNSVPGSPTMFSRRVVEIAASGGVVISGPSRALDELFPQAFPAGLRLDDVQGYMHLWSTDPEERRREAWRQMRVVLRAHLVDDALAIIVRTAGIPVARSSRASYGVDMAGIDGDAILEQSVLPVAVIGVQDPVLRSALEARGIEVLDTWQRTATPPDWIASGVRPTSRTYFEDLLLATEFGSWDQVVAMPDGIPGTRALAAIGSAGDGSAAVTRTPVLLGHESATEGRTVLLAIAGSEAAYREAPPRGGDAITVQEPKRLLVAGHDLKFIEPAFSMLEQRGFAIEVDRWHSHASHDEERSLEMLARADVVLAEWALGNAVWYAEHRASTQRLVVRAHMQELRRPYLARAAARGVDEFVFVNEVVRRSATLAHGVQHGRSRVIPNMVRTAELARPKRSDASHRIGFVGFVPRMKRLDRALDVLERVLERDPSYSLVVKGRSPADFAWMQQRPDELAYYEAQYRRAEEIMSRYPGSVAFEPHGDDMAEWYRGVDTVLSVSDFESFHYTVADGAASGAHPVVLAWGGADLLYPQRWLHASVAEAADAVLGHWSEHDAAQAAAFVGKAYGMDSVTAQLAEVLHGAAR